MRAVAVAVAAIDAVVRFVAASLVSPCPVPGRADLARLHSPGVLPRRDANDRDGTGSDRVSARSEHQVPCDGRMSA